MAMVSRSTHAPTVTSAMTMASSLSTVQLGLLPSGLPLIHHSVSASCVTTRQYDGFTIAGDGIRTDEMPVLAEGLTVTSSVKTQPSKANSTL